MLSISVSPQLGFPFFPVSEAEPKQIQGPTAVCALGYCNSMPVPTCHGVVGHVGAGLNFDGYSSSPSVNGVTV